MTTTEERAWCSIADAKGIGSKTLWSIAEYLSERQQTASWLLEHPDEIKSLLKGRSIQSATEDPTAYATDDVDEERVWILHPLHHDFPIRLRMLKERASLPALLYARGNTRLLQKPGVAIVGARNAGDMEREIAVTLASELGRRGINVTSGYAKGIDMAAHYGSLQGNGTTSIVLSEGINRFRSKPELREFFTSENTVVVSQFQPNTRWAKHFAMTRNKLVCALSHAVVVVVSRPERDSEGRMSGTFDAGVTAIEMGITAFTVEPSVFDGQPEGNKQLIARGCRAWDPSDGAEPIVAAINDAIAEQSRRLVSKMNKQSSRQMTLF